MSDPNERWLDLDPRQDEPPIEQPSAELVPVADAELVGPDLFPHNDEWERLCVMAATLANASLVPRPLQGRPADVLLILLTARSLGIDPTAAIRLCHVIDGKVTVAPKMRLALLNLTGKGRVVPTDVSATSVTGAVYRGDQLVETRTLDMTEVPADLRRKNNWRDYPQRMLWWRLCLPTRAEALTRQGWVAHNKLAVGDKVLAFDMSSGLTVWSAVQAVNVFDDTPTIRAAHSRFATTSTPDHRWVTDSPDNPGAYEFRTTGQLSDNQQRRILAAAPHQWPQVADQQAQARDAAILGWLLTDGTWRWRGNSPTGTIYQTKHVNILRALLKDTRHTEDAVPARQRTIRGEQVNTRESCAFRLAADELRELLNRFGIREKSDAALIPAQLSPVAAQAMFEAMMTANGKSNGAAFITGHRSVMDCFQILATLLGIRLGVEKNVGRDSDTWIVSLQQTPHVANKRLEYEAAGVEPVWCPTTEHGTWVTRLDGQVTITGNSGWLLDDHFPEVGSGLYSPDELGAVTDADGEPITVESVEPAFVDRKPAQPKPANPELVAGLQTRLGLLKPPDGVEDHWRPEWESLRTAVLDDWKQQIGTTPEGYGLPPDRLDHQQAQRAAALLRRWAPKIDELWETWRDATGNDADIADAELVDEDDERPFTDDGYYE